MGEVLRLPREVRGGSADEGLDGRSDEELMALIRIDSRAAFRVLVTRHAEKVASFCARIAGDRAPAREISQAVWLALWDARLRWQPRASFVSYLYTIAFSRARNHARSRRRKFAVFAPVPIDHDTVLDGRPNEVDRLLEIERRERILAALDALPGPMREAVVLRFVDELSYEEMVKIEGTNASTLRSRVHHALARLRAALEEVP
jgi:RNA polymerase sigma-70 factor (ECF subfamily)